MITKNHRQEALYRAYAHVIAARCGIVYGSTTLDGGIDLSIHGVIKFGEGYGDSGFKIEAQVEDQHRGDFHADSK